MSGSRRTRRRFGFTALEAMLASAIGAGVIGGGVSLLAYGAGLGHDLERVDDATERACRIRAMLSQDLALAAGPATVSGGGSGMTIPVVREFQNDGMVKADALCYRFERRQGGVQLLRGDRPVAGLLSGRFSTSTGAAGEHLLELDLTSPGTRRGRPIGTRLTFPLLPGEDCPGLRVWVQP